MIKKLKIKFILLSLSALLVVLCALLAAINIVNYSTVVREADELLWMLSDNKGRFPKDMDMSMPNMMGDVPMNNPLPSGISPELPYETRYFSVLLSSTGSVIQAETGSIAAIDTEDAISMARDVAAGSTDRGFTGNYRFGKTTEQNGTRVVFVDCGRKLDSFRSFLLASCLISLAGFGVVSLLIIFFSGRIIRPFAESYEKQKRFITDAGHEIKTPLTIINADVDILEMDLGENEWLADIQRQTKRLTALTNDLVLLSRMEEPNSSLPMIDFPVSDVVNEAASSFYAPAQAQGKVLELHISAMLTMHGSGKSISQLVTILLDNALKYSPEGGTISLTLERRGKQLLLSVLNPTDSPLPTGDLSLLFERFYRTDPSRSTQTGGHGIGLSVAQAIVTAHGGKIQARSRDGSSLLIAASFPL